MSDPSSSAPTQVTEGSGKNEAREEEVASREETIDHLRRLLAEKDEELEETKHDFAVMMRNTLALQRITYETEIRELREGRRARVGLLRPRHRG